MISLFSCLFYLFTRSYGFIKLFILFICLFICVLRRLAAFTRRIPITLTNVVISTSREKSTNNPDSLNRITLIAIQALEFLPIWLWFAPYYLVITYITRIIIQALESSTAASSPTPMWHWFAPYYFERTRWLCASLPKVSVTDEQRFKLWLAKFSVYIYLLYTTLWNRPNRSFKFLFIH